MIRLYDKAALGEGAGGPSRSRIGEGPWMIEARVGKGEGDLSGIETTRAAGEGPTTVVCCFGDLVRVRHGGGKCPE